MDNDFLIIAGTFSLLAAVLHFGVIIGGPSWYRFFGAGESLALLAEKGSAKPTVITLCIAAVLIVWCVYAWSAAGIMPGLPLVKPALLSITGIYLVRGVAGFAAPFVLDHPQVKQNSTAFWLWSSAICLVIGVVHLIGVIAVWPSL